MHTIARDERTADSARAARAGSRQVAAGRVLSGLAAAFLVFDSAGKLFQLEPVLDGTVALGYARDTVFPLGVVLLACVAAYLAPRTSVLGALLLTGYLGGAVATHVRVGHPLATHVLFPVYVAAVLWAGLVLRDRRLLAFLPLRREP